MTNESSDIPFDLKHHRHIIYGASIEVLRKSLTDELIWAKKQINTARSSRIKVQLKEANGNGNLERTQRYAKGTIDFKIDLHNEKNSASAEIDAIYFYCSKQWKLYQDGKECPSTDSDVEGVPIRHFLTPPIRRLNKNSWAQLKFQAKKHIAWSHEGEELRDSYHLTGRSLIRIVTAEGNFDYDIFVDTTIDEIPF